MTESPKSADASIDVGGIVTRLGPAAVLGVWSAAMPALGSIALYWAMFSTNMGPWMKSHGSSGVAAYAVAFAALAGLAVLPTYAQSALGGYAFGVVWGSAGALIGFAGGAIIGYEVAARASGDRAMRLIDEHPKWRAVRDALVGTRVGGGVVEVPPGFWKTLGMVTLLRLPINSPFAITNLVMASVKVPRMPYLIGTIIGLAPRTVLVVVVGAGVSTFTREELKKAMPWWAIVIGIVGLIVVAAVITRVANRALARYTSRTTTTSEQPPAARAGQNSPDDLPSNVA